LKDNKITSILKYTKTQENHLMQSHERHISKLNEEKEQLNVLNNELEMLINIDHTTISLHQLANLHGYSDIVKNRINNQEGVVDNQTNVVYESAQKIVEVRKDLKKYEKLDDKIKERVKIEEELEMTKQLDEIGIRNYMFNN